MSADGETQTSDDEAAPPPVQPKAHIPPVTAIRAHPPKPKRLSRKTLMAASLVLSAIVAFALVNGLSDRERRTRCERRTPTGAARLPAGKRAHRPSRVQRRRFAPADRRRRPRLFLGRHRPDGEAEDLEAAAPSAPAAPSPLEIEADAARIFGHSLRRGGSPTWCAGRRKRGAAAPGPGAAFLASQRGRDDGVLDAAYRPPRSPYAIQAGSTISAALGDGAQFRSARPRRRASHRGRL